MKWTQRKALKGRSVFFWLHHPNAHINTQTFLFGARMHALSQKMHTSTCRGIKEPL